MCIQCLSNVYWYLSNGNTNLAASSWKLHVQQRSRFPKAVLRRQRRVAGASQEHRLPACLAAGDWGLTMKNLWKDPGQLWKNIYIRKKYIYIYGIFRDEKNRWENTMGFGWVSHFRRCHTLLAACASPKTSVQKRPHRIIPQQREYRC